MTDYTRISWRKCVQEAWKTRQIFPTWQVLLYFIPLVQEMRNQKIRVYP